jgi:hypothetical protein
VPAVVTTVIHGPSIDDLNLWGDLDSLLWSLDDLDVWPEADLFTLAISETVTATGTLGCNVVRNASVDGVAVSYERMSGCCVISGHLQDTATSIEKFHSGYISAELHSFGEGSEHLSGQVLCRAGSHDEFLSYEHFHGELRGHLWRERDL